MTDLATLWASVPQLSNIHASEDGAWAFWCMAGVTETENVWCAPLDASAPPRMLTNGHDHYLIRDVAPDGSRLILAQSLNANEHDHLLTLDRDTGALTQITPTQDTHYVYGGALAKDGTAIFFLADFDYDRNEVTEGAWLWRQDLSTGVRTCLARADSPPHFYVGPLLSPDGTRLLWHRSDRAPGGYQLWLMPVAGDAVVKVLDLGEKNNVLACWLDDDRIGFACDHDGRDKLGVLTLSTGAVDWRAEEPQLFPHSVVAGTGSDFLCIHHQASHTRAALVGPAGIRPLPNHSGRRSLLPHAALPGGGWLAEAYDADAPHDLVAIAADGTCRSIFRAAPEASRQHVAPEDFRWTAPDGMAMQGWLYRPEGRPKGLIGYVHGGPTWHSEDWVNPKIQFWVANGYAALDPNYRGSTGFGYAHREAVKEDGWGGREQSDIRAGLEAALAAGIPGPVAVAGNSYGGFSSWFAITRHADLVTAAIPMCGMYRLDIDYHATEMPHGRAYSEEMMGGTPEEFPEKYANASPGRFIDQIRGQVMIVHGLADSNVGPENTHVAIRELTAAGIPHEVLLFADEGHGIFRRRNVATYLRRSAEFLDKALQGATDLAVSQLPAVLVVGSLHHDIMVEADHLPRVDETAVGTRWYPKFGGKGGNQAIAAGAAGVAARMLGAVGRDGFGDFLLAGLDQGQVDRRFVRQLDGVGSGMSVAIQDPAGDYAATIVSGANLRIDPARLADPALWKNVRVLVLQNEIPEAVNLAAAHAARALNVPVILNAAPARALSDDLRLLVDVLVVNAVEAEMSGAGPVTDLGSALAAAGQLAARYRQVIVTAGAQGLAVCSAGGEPVAVPARQVKVASTHGAGDCFTGTLAAKLALGLPLIEACRAASDAAARHVAGETGAARMTTP